MPDKKPTDPTAGPKPTEGEQTAAQTPNFPLAFMGGGTMLMGGSPMLYSGGCAENPCGFPGYGPGFAGGYFGFYGTYRWMLEHPTLRLARAVVLAPILASSWFIEHDDDVDDKAVETIDRTFSSLRDAALPEILRGIDYGWSPFEPIWSLNDDGRWVIERLKPLLVDSTTPLIDQGGTCAALQPGSFGGSFGVTAADSRPLSKSDLQVAKGKAWLYTHDGEAGNVFGRSRLENVRRTAWRDWLDTAQQIQALAGKVSGRQAYGIVPGGGYNHKQADGTTVYRTYAQDAADAMIGFGQGKNPILTAPALAAAMAGNDLNAIKQMIGAAPVTFEVIDFGTESQAISSLLDRLKYDDGQMFAGYLRSPRTGMESENGSRADSQQHTDTGMTDSQLLGNDVCRQLQPLVDFMGRVNWGLRKGAVRLRQSPLVDDQKQTLQAIVPLLLGDPATLKVVNKIVDIDKVLDALDVPRDGDAEQAEKEVAQEMADQQAQQQQHEQAMAAKPMLPRKPGKPGQPGDPNAVTLSRGDDEPAPLAPVVNFAAGAMKFHLFEQPATQVHVAAPPPAQVIVNVPEQQPPQVTVNVPELAAPAVTVNVPEAPAAQITVNVPEQKPVRVVRTITRDAEGRVNGSIEEPLTKK